MCRYTHLARHACDDLHLQRVDVDGEADAERQTSRFHRHHEPRPPSQAACSHHGSDYAETLAVRSHHAGAYAKTEAAHSHHASDFAETQAASSHHEGNHAEAQAERAHHQSGHAETDAERHEASDHRDICAQSQEVAQALDPIPDDHEDFYALGGEVPAWVTEELDKQDEAGNAERMRQRIVDRQRAIDRETAELLAAAPQPRTLYCKPFPTPRPAAGQAEADMSCFRWPSRWWVDEGFWQAVHLDVDYFERQLGRHIDASFLMSEMRHRMQTFQGEILTWLKLVEAAHRHTKQKCQGCNGFKIGITENAPMRWRLMREDKYPNFTSIVLLYVAPTGRWKPCGHDGDHVLQLKKYSTSEMEQQLISKIEIYDSRLLNRPGAGGEGASFGTPHYCYLMLR